MLFLHVKNLGDFCINWKASLWNIALKVGSNPLFKRVKIYVCYLEMQGKKFCHWFFFSWLKYQPRKEQKIFATIPFGHWCSFQFFLVDTTVKHNILDFFLKKTSLLQYKNKNELCDIGTYSPLILVLHQWPQWTGWWETHYLQS